MYEKSMKILPLWWRTIKNLWVSSWPTRL